MATKKPQANSPASNADGSYLPMPFTSTGKGQRLKGPELEEYRERHKAHLRQYPDYVLGWHRPTRTTAEAVWAIVAPTFAPFVAAERWLPRFPRPQTLTNEERDAYLLQAKQALVVVLDTFVIHAADRRTMTYTEMFEALASRWSDHYRDTVERERAFCLIDMAETTVQACRRDLLRIGLRTDTLWRLASGEVVASREAWSENPLYEQIRRTFSGRQVIAKDTLKLQQFEALILADDEYQRRDRRPRLLLASDPMPPPHRRQKVAGEAPYNVVEMTTRSRKVLHAQEATKVVFDVDRFMTTYAAAIDKVDRLRETCRDTFNGFDPELSPYKPMQPGMTRPAPSLRELALYKLPAAKRNEVQRLCKSYDQVRGLVANHKGVHDEIVKRKLIGAVEITSRFTRVVNRRFQPLNFSPLSATSKVQSWEEPDPDEADFDLDEDGAGLGPRARWFRFRIPFHDANPYDPEVSFEEREMVGYDVSSSVTQILAILLGIKQLEEVAATSFNDYLAREAYQTEKTLRPGYEAENDRQLVAACKSLWMRTIYGSSPDTVVKEQRRDPATYGPGFISGESAMKFLAGLPWFDEVAMYLALCKRIAEAADKTTGVVFTDPFDRAKPRWNPIARGACELSSDGTKLIVRLPGRLRGAREFNKHDEYKGVRRFTRAVRDKNTGEYPVDRAKLGRFLAPAVIHTCDAYLSGLILERLAARDVPAIGLHDSWLVPSDIETHDSGQVVLKNTIDDAAREWLLGLRPIYDLLRTVNDPVHRKLVATARRRWRQRILAKKWPAFAVKPAKTRPTGLPPEHQEAHLADFLEVDTEAEAVSYLFDPR